MGGNPALNQSCNSTPLCLENNWTSALIPTSCPSNGQQTKEWKKTGQCQDGVSHPSKETVSCNYQAPNCTIFTYSDWGTCDTSGMQTRFVSSSLPSACIDGNPVLSKGCGYVSSVISNKVSDVEIKDNPTVSTNNQNSQNEPQINQIQSEPSLVKNNEQEVIQEKNTTDSHVVEPKRSEVADVVQEMLQIAERDDEVGQQVKIIAQTQTQNQEKIKVSLQKVQSRNSFTKFFVGPNYGEVNNVKKLLEQNREQIKHLDRIQITSEDDKQKLTEQVKLLEQTNREIENSLNTSQKGFSLFGWIFRMFAK